MGDEGGVRLWDLPIPCGLYGGVALQSLELAAPRSSCRGGRRTPTPLACLVARRMRGLRVQEYRGRSINLPPFMPPPLPPLSFSSLIPSAPLSADMSSAEAAVAIPEDVMANIKARMPPAGADLAKFLVQGGQKKGRFWSSHVTGNT